MFPGTISITRRWNTPNCNHRLCWLPILNVTDISWVRRGHLQLEWTIGGEWLAGVYLDESRIETWKVREKVVATLVVTAMLPIRLKGHTLFARTSYRNIWYARIGDVLSLLSSSTAALVSFSVKVEGRRRTTVVAKEIYLFPGLSQQFSSVARVRWWLLLDSMLEWAPRATNNSRASS